MATEHCWPDERYGGNINFECMSKMVATECVSGKTCELHTGKEYLVSCFSFCMLWKFMCAIMVFSIWYGTMNIFSSFVSMSIVDNDW